MQPQNSNPYDFITSPQQPEKRPTLGGSLKSRIIVVVVGIIVLGILGAIISNILSSAGKQAIQNLKNVSAEQTEIIRVSGLGTENALGPQAKGYAITVNMVLKTSQLELNERLSAHKIKMTKIEQNAKFNKNTEELLKSASSNNRYDEQITEILDELLEKHKKTLKNAFDSTKSQQTKDALNKAYANIESLTKAKSPNAQ